MSDSGDVEGWWEQLFAANTRTSEIPYPITVMSARYGGTYEGGDWLAFNCHPDDVSTDAYGCDITCATFWGWGRNDGQPKVGRGSTPNQAIADLIKRLG